MAALPGVIPKFCALARQMASTRRQINEPKAEIQEVIQIPGGMGTTVHVAGQEPAQPKLIEVTDSMFSSS